MCGVFDEQEEANKIEQTAQRKEQLEGGQRGGDKPGGTSGADR